MRDHGSSLAPERDEWSYQIVDHAACQLVIKQAVYAVYRLSQRVCKRQPHGCRLMTR